MKRLFFLLVFALLPFAASAQDCNLKTGCNIELTQEAKSSAGNRHLYWFWYDKFGILRVDGVSCVRTSCDLEKFAGVVWQVFSGVMSRETAEGAFLQGQCKMEMIASPTNSLQRLCNERYTLYQQNRERWLKDLPLRKYVWRVKVNGSSETRPAYTLTNGVRSNLSTARATVGVRCYPEIVMDQFSGADVWAIYNAGALDSVALCARSAQ